MKILDAINEQANFELESAYVYLTMSSYMADQKMIGFLQEVGYAVKYRPLDPGDGKFDSLLDVFKKALAHEKQVTENIYKLVDLARKEDYKPAESMLQWYVDEQVEEEDTFNTLITQLERAGSNWGALYQIDHYLSKR